MTIINNKMMDQLNDSANSVIDKMGDSFKSVYCDYSDRYLINAGLTYEEIIIFRLRCFAVAFDEYTKSNIDICCKRRDTLLKRLMEYSKSIGIYEREGNTLENMPTYITYMGDVIASYTFGVLRGNGLTSFKVTYEDIL